jgi:hypothetical protein
MVFVFASPILSSSIRSLRSSRSENAREIEVKSESIFDAAAISINQFQTLLMKLSNFSLDIGSQADEEKTKLCVRKSQEVIKGIELCYC